MIGRSVQHPRALILGRDTVISTLNALDSPLELRAEVVVGNCNKLGQDGLPRAAFQAQLHRPRSLSNLLRERRQHKN